MPRKGNASAGAAATTTSPAPKPKGSNSNSQQTPALGSTERNKVAVRRCPSELPEAVFWKSVEPWISEEDVDWKSYRPGRSKRVGQTNKEGIDSVAYIHFKRQDLVTKFASGYQGHVFRDSKGQISQVAVEYAPYQKIPTKRPKLDALAGTIEQDPDYLAFVASLANPEPDKSAIVEVPTRTKVVIKTTPLLEELRRQKQLAAEKRSAKKKKGVVDSGPTSTAAASGPKKTRAERRAAAKAVKKEVPVKEIEAKDATSDNTARKRREHGETKAIKAGNTAQKSPAAQQANPGGKGGSNAPSSDKRDSKAIAKGSTKAESGKAPSPMMTILAPPRQKPSPGQDSFSVNQEGAPAPPANRSAPRAPNRSSQAPPTAKAPSSAPFDAVVDQFARQMSVKPVSASDKSKDTPPSSISKGSIAAGDPNISAPHPSLGPQSLSQAGNTNRSRGAPGPRGARGRGVSLAARTTSISSKPNLTAGDSASSPKPENGQPVQVSQPMPGRGRGRGANPARGSFAAAQRGTQRGGRGSASKDGAPPVVTPQQQQQGT